MGCVVRVSAAGRTATVQWANGGAPTEHSVYQLQVGLAHASRGCPKNNVRNNKNLTRKLSLAEAGDIGVPTKHGMYQLKLQDVMLLTCDEWMSLKTEQ